MATDNLNELLELEQFECLTITELDILIQNLKELRREKFDAKYKVITVVNGKGNIANTIKEETGFNTQWHPVVQTLTGYCGSHSIMVPRETYTEELEKELKQKYDR